MHRLRGLRSLVLAALVLGPSIASAGDGLHPRTPVLWEDPPPPCMTIVNRSVDPVLSLNYTIPYEDLRPEYDPDDMSTWHEVDDGRTHQFFGFCRDHNPQESLPNWITDVDVAAAIAKELVNPDIVKLEDVFETSTEWAGCWHRITEDDERRTITFEEAAKPVLWDTTDLEPGGYVIEGYTWEPQPSIWSFRTGVVKVVDSDDLAASPPAVAIENNADSTYPDEPVTLDVCHSATDGSTLTAYWSFTAQDKQTWVPFLEDEPITGETSQIDFKPPPETIAESVMLRIDITDPMDRKATAYANYTIIVLKDANGTGGECDSSFIIDPECETTDASGSETTSASESGTTDDGSGSDGSDSLSSTGPASATASGGEDDTTTCACRLEDPRPAAGLTLLTLLLLSARRRR